MKLNFALCTDEKFAVPTLVTITSIFENHKNHECIVTVLANKITDKSIDKLNNLSNYYRQRINVHHITTPIFNDMVTIDRYPVTMYYRYLLPQLLKDTDKVLYLDGDILVRASLKNLFEIDLNGYACGAVVDQECDNSLFYERLGTTSDYFNSGVLLMNLNEWRKNDYCKKLISFVEHNPEKCLYPDQDALNVVLSNKILYLDLKYNLQERLLTQLHLCHFKDCRYPELHRAKPDAKIIHFCTSEKPWHSLCRNPYYDEYQKYAKLHSFIGYESETIDGIVPKDQIPEYIRNTKDGLKNDIIAFILKRWRIWNRDILVYKKLLKISGRNRNIKEIIIDTCICNCNRPVLGFVSRNALKVIHNALSRIS